MNHMKNRIIIIFYVNLLLKPQYSILHIVSIILQNQSIIKERESFMKKTLLKILGTMSTELRDAGMCFFGFAIHLLNLIGI